MNLRWITLFATIAEEGSFTRAATKLNVAQPWLSAQLRKLEYELGVQLLVRGNVGVHVTEAGAMLLPHAQQLTESARMFRQIARGLGETQSKVVQLGSDLPIIDIPSLKALSVSFASRYKEFELSTNIGGVEELLKLLRDAAVDFALISSSVPEGSDDLECCRLASAHICLLSPRKQAVDSLAAARGKAVGVPPRNWAPELYRKLVAEFQNAGVEAREVPEFDRRALEHMVLVHDMVIATLVDDDTLDSVDAQIHVAPIEGLAFDHLLCRIANRPLGRAAERFWSLAKTAGGQLPQEPLNRDISAV